jgi:hypothetical protein
MPGAMVTLPGRNHNYKALWLEYLSAYKSEGKTQVEFCKDKDLEPTMISRHFAELKREAQIDLFKRRNTGILLKAQSNVHKALEADQVKPEFSLDAYKAIADREGLSPQAQIINIQNQATAGVVLAPFFSQPDDDLKNLLGGE